MKKEEALKLCRVYRGEDRPPFDRLTGQYDFCFWEAERLFVENCGNFDFQKESVSFMFDNGAYTPSTFNIILQSMLFGTFCHGSDTDPLILAQTFKDKVIKAYLTL